MTLHVINKFLLNSTFAQGTLYVILGESKQSLATRRNWELMNKLWPALVLTPHCEKTSINLIHDAIVDKIHKDIETVEIAMKVSFLLDTSNV